MFKRTVIATSVALAIAALPAVAQEEEGSFLDEWEIAGELKNETAVFTKDGTTIGAASAHDNGDLMKSETSARLFINGVVGESAELHAELRPVRDGEAIDGMKGHENYTQQDWLRELYVDTVTGEEEEIALRIGKQQVVWGTADGMKLLDIINPTDYREMAQNSMDESRIPVWMINAETDLEDGSNVQVVISQPKENVFAGLDRNIDTSDRQNNTTTLADETTNNGHQTGSAFIMKGVDTIAGDNGFLNGVPDLAGMAARFSAGFGGAANLYGGGTGTTVGEYAGNASNSGFPSGFNGDGASIIYGIASTNYNFNLSDSTSAAVWNANIGNPDSMFEFMDRTMFSTFDAFNNASSQYVYDMPSDSDADVAFRVKRSTDDGLNYSVNYSYNYGKNPVIDLGWYNSAGEKLKVVYGAQNADDSAILSIRDEAETVYYGGGGQGSTAGTATLRFTETLKREHNLGGSFDTAIDTEEFGAVVLRGEALYQKDVYSPVFNRGKLAVGDLVGALKMEKGDRFKYVLGADVTVMTNMMVSAQFIQDRNLDHVDNDVDWDGTACTTADGANCGVYTADFATMHMSNNFQKAEKNKEFYSLFFSKPFGNEQQHRWNNIFMYEENGGKWNRLDVEYSFNDEIIGTAEYNKYWGDANTQFGQMEKSSNFQLGLKYIF